MTSTIIENFDTTVFATSSSTPQTDCDGRGICTRETLYRKLHRYKLTPLQSLARSEPATPASMAGSAVVQCKTSIPCNIDSRLNCVLTTFLSSPQFELRPEDHMPQLQSHLNLILQRRHWRVHQLVSLHFTPWNRLLVARVAG